MCRYLSITLLLLPLITNACASMVPSTTGLYEPIDGPQGDLPLRIRDVTVWLARTDQFDEQALPVPLEASELGALERELRDALLDDLTSAGPFRTAAPGELAYELDVEILRLGMPVRAGSSTLVQVFHGLTLFATALIGVPIAFLGKEGDGRFSLYAPDGGALTISTEASIRGSYALGLYYNHGRSLGDIVAQMAKQFKQDVGACAPDLELAGG